MQCAKGVKKTLEQRPLGASYDDDDDANISQELDTSDNANSY